MTRSFCGYSNTFTDTSVGAEGRLDVRAKGAVGAVVLALVGCLAHLSLPSLTEEATKRMVGALAHRAYVAAFVLALVVAILGVSVASYKSF